MKPIGIAGMALIIIGIVVLVMGGSFTKHDDVLKVGDFKVTTSEEKSIPPWAAGLAIAAGVLLVVSGARRRN